jgi:hypothetical protein
MSKPKRTKGWKPLAVGALLGGLSCGSAEPPSTSTRPKIPAASPPAAEAAPKPRGPEILAEAQGKLGVIRVERHGDTRVLTIDGVVQGGSSASTRPRDPMVDLIAAMRPKARTALVIGLGTGRTASALAALGLSVDVVEIEPSVVEFARRFFGYSGRATIADGVEYLKTVTDHWDIVLVDAFTGGAPGPAFATQALKAASNRTSARGITAARVVARPSDDAVYRMLRDWEDTCALYGSGVGDEPQNLYLFRGRILMVAGVEGVAAWPLVIPQYCRAMHKGASLGMQALGVVASGWTATSCACSRTARSPSICPTARWAESDTASPARPPRNSHVSCPRARNSRERGREQRDRDDGRTPAARAGVQAGRGVSAQRRPPRTSAPAAGPAVAPVWRAAVSLWFSPVLTMST